MAENDKLIIISEKKNIIPEEKDCGICCNNYNKSTRKKIVCPYEDKCGKTYCSACFATFLVDSQLNPVCMWCRSDLSMEFIENNSTKIFYGKYMDYRAGIFMERKKSRLADLQDRADTFLRDRRFFASVKERREEFVSLISEIRKIKSDLEMCYEVFGITSKNPFRKCKNKSIESVSANLQNDRDCSLCDQTVLYSQFNDKLYVCESCNMRKCDYCARMCLLVNDMKCVNCDEDEFSIERIKRFFPNTYYNKFFKPRVKRQDSDEYVDYRLLIIKKVREKLSVNESLFKISLDLYRIKYGLDWNSEGTQEIKREIQKFIKKCPDSDCRGFLSSAWKCGICTNFFCKDCHAKKRSHDEYHTCNESEKATVEMLNKDTKPCPQCGIPIHKYVGCNHMFTPCCNIGFDWKSGKIIANNRNTSPEYYEFMRRTNGGVVPREIGDDPCAGIVEYHIVRASLVNIGSSLYTSYHQLMTHTNNILLPRLPAVTGNFDSDNLGVMYLIGDINEIKWKSELKKLIKKDEKNNNIYHVLNMFVNVINDFFRNLMEDHNVIVFRENADRLIEYVNSQIKTINKRYGSLDRSFFLKLEHFS